MKSVEDMFRNGLHHVIGRGRMGQTLENGLREAGRKLTREIGEADVVWFCVPESVLREAFINRSEEIRPGTIRLHTSGFLPASVLTDDSGSWTGALHPAYSFPRPLARMPEHILWTFEGSNELQAMVSELTERWRGSLHILKENDKAAYHVICVLLANLTTIPVSIARDLSERIGLPFTRMTESLLLPVLDRIQRSEHEGLSHLTGPAARGDGETVRAQIAWLMDHDPIAADVYRSLSESIRRYRNQSDSSKPGAE